MTRRGWLWIETIGLARLVSVSPSARLDRRLMWHQTWRRLGDRYGFLPGWTAAQLADIKVHARARAERVRGLME